ncbi:MAG TPA: WcaF family extracellular polysaccharide biosynthesis acetyltransferase [Bryobacteraceae bacterium]|jgi:putative colanic acid biosynthesis acetyltransferase WcaF|nr:WcaF family extracellular polysaccharide biosynthesis acetyltransferase [Bryobacteraceae bacterium]
MSAVDLGRYNNDWFRPGRSRFWQMAWFFLGSPLLRSTWLPFSGPRVRLLRWFGAELGTGIVIKPGVRVKYPWNLKIGDNCWLGEDCWIDNLTAVELGSNVCLSQGAYLCTGNHDWSDPKFGLIIKPILLSRGSWVGARALVAPGVKLGEHSIAAAGSIVARDIPAWEIHAGNPAVFLRRRSLPENPSAEMSSRKTPAEEFVL